MKICSLEKVRNFAVLGHAGAGKTSLCELMLFKAGAIPRCGTVVDKSTVSDYRKEEQDRGSSVYTSVLNCVWNEHMFFFSDNPGYADFCGETCAATEAANEALIVIDSIDGIGPGTTRAWMTAEEDSVPRAFFINGMDKSEAHYEEIMETLKESYGPLRITPMVIPIGHGASFSKVVHILRTPDDQIPEEYRETVMTDRQRLLDTLAESDESLMERYLSGEKLSDEEISKGLHSAIVKGEVIPVFCGSVSKDIGITEMMNGVVNLFPSAIHATPFPLEDDKFAERDPNDPEGLAWCFKSVTDAHMGQILYLRVISGTWKGQQEVFNVNQGTTERLSALMVPRGKAMEEIDVAIPGTIVAVTKLKSTKIGDTLCLKNSALRKVAPIRYPIPNMIQAVSTPSKSDNEKMGIALSKYSLEDPTLVFERHPETHQELLRGMGDQHFSVIRQRIKADYKLDLNFDAPRVPYRETINGSASASYRHKKQSGGHGQFAEVHIKVEPCEGYEFVNAVVGGVIPKNYIPAVEKGVQEVMECGPLAHCHVENVRVTVFDGKDHPVDSSEMAFKIAARTAFREALKQAHPALLEPIMKMKVYIPESYMGDVTSDLNSRRARICGMGVEGGLQFIEAEIPRSETYTYATTLRSIAQGKGFFEVEPLRYEVVPANLAQKIQAEVAKLEQEEDA